jgi:hypothetical protein
MIMLNLYLFKVDTHEEYGVSYKNIPAHSLEEASAVMQNEIQPPITFEFVETSAFFREYCKENMSKRRYSIRLRHAKRYQDMWQAFVDDRSEVSLGRYDKWTFQEMLEATGYSYTIDDSTHYMTVYPCCDEAPLS